MLRSLQIYTSLTPTRNCWNHRGRTCSAPLCQKMGGCFESQAVLKLSANLKLCHTGQAVSFYRVMVFSLAPSFPIYWLYPLYATRPAAIRTSTSSCQGVPNKKASVAKQLRKICFKKSLSKKVKQPWLVLFFFWQRSGSDLVICLDFTELAASSKSQGGIRFLYKKPTNQGTLQVPTIASRTF